MTFPRRPARRETTPVDERYFVASQWRMMWRKLVRHRLAVIAAAVLAVAYLVAGFAEFVAPAAAGTRNNDFIHAPPQRIRFFSEEGLHLRPFVYGLTQTRNMETMRREYAVDPSRRHLLRLFVRGDPYELWGVIPSDVHLIGTDGGPVFLLGADRLGRDVLSRVIYGARISLSIGLVGVAISFVLGCLFGGVSGYYGGAADLVIQRVIEFMLSIPTIRCGWRCRRRCRRSGRRCASSS